MSCQKCFECFVWVVGLLCVFVWVWYFGVWIWGVCCFNGWVCCISWNSCRGDLNLCLLSSALFAVFMILFMVVCGFCFWFMVVNYLRVLEFAILCVVVVCLWVGCFATCLGFCFGGLCLVVFSCFTHFDSASLCICYWLERVTVVGGSACLFVRWMCVRL